MFLAQTLPGLHKEVLNWEQKYKESLSVDELRKKVGTLKKEMVWALVYEEEKVRTQSIFLYNIFLVCVIYSVSPIIEIVVFTGY